MNLSKTLSLSRHFHNDCKKKTKKRIQLETFFNLKIGCFWLPLSPTIHPTSQRLTPKLIVRAVDLLLLFFPSGQHFLFISLSRICSLYQICLYRPFLIHACWKIPVVLTVALEKDGFVMKARFRLQTEFGSWWWCRFPLGLWDTTVMCRDSWAGGRNRQHIRCAWQSWVTQVSPAALHTWARYSMCLSPLCTSI